MLSISEFLIRQFGDYHFYGNPPTDYRVDCPFCGDDIKGHLHVSMDKHVVHCFRCGYKNNWVGMVMDITGMPYHKALGELYEPPKIRGDIREEITTRMEEIRYDSVYLEQFSLPYDFRLLRHKKFKSDNLYVRAAKHYLIGRGFGSWYWQRYRLGIAPSQGYRVIIPVERDYWQGRAVFDWMKPKYLNPGDPARDVIFNPHALDLYDHVVICEGSFSAMAVGENASALIGKEPTVEKIERLLQSQVSKFSIALEPGAFETMRTLADALSRGGKQVEIWNYSEGDPASGGGFVVMDYGLKSRLSLDIQGKFSRSIV